MQTYTLTVRTSCERCAFALAGHAPALGTIRSVVVTTEGHDGATLTLHSNHPMLKAHDGSPLACPQHGLLVDLAHEPRPASAPTSTRALSSLRPEQQARRIDPTACALHVILDETLAERETASLAHAVARVGEHDEALRISVAAASAVDVALHALTSYVVHGFYQPREIAEAEEDPLHERCRIARNVIARRIGEILRAHRCVCGATIDKNGRHPGNPEIGPDHYASDRATELDKAPVSP